MSASHIDIAPVPDETISRLLQRRAREEPDTVYLQYLAESCTLAQLDRRVNQLANRLIELGVRKGDHVALMLPNHPDHVVAMYALTRLGAVRVPVNIHLKGAPLRHVFDSLKPVAMIADAAHAAALHDVQVCVPACLWRDGAVEGGERFETYLECSDAAPDVAIGPDDILALTPSSGTTGAPKGVLKSDRTLRAGPMAILRLTEARRGDVFLLWESLHHGAGVAVVISALIGGTRLAMLEKFSASRFWDDARRYGATHIHYLGSVVPMLLKQPPREGDRGHGVRVAWGGGCPPHLWNDFSQRFGVEMREGYGLSEMITFVTANPRGPAGSVGKPLEYFDVDLIDDNGGGVADGESGEIIVRARAAGLGFLGYYDNPEADRAARRGDWFCTGDLGRRDAQGFYYYAGRKKDMLRRRGINISSWEVERVFAEHPAIEEAALVGVPSDLGEDELKLFVRLKAGAELDPLDLVRWSEPKLPYFQIPRYVAFVDQFPKTATQRIQKKELSREVAGVWCLDDTGYVIKK
jgi:crotonobetaine/carnitine-CoA ligase